MDKVGAGAHAGQQRLEWRVSLEVGEETVGARAGQGSGLPQEALVAVEAEHAPATLAEERGVAARAAGEV